MATKKYELTLTDAQYELLVNETLEIAIIDALMADGTEEAVKQARDIVRQLKAQKN